MNKKSISLMTALAGVIVIGGGVALYRALTATIAPDEVLSVRPTVSEHESVVSMEADLPTLAADERADMPEAGTGTERDMSARIPAATSVPMDPVPPPEDDTVDNAVTAPDFIVRDANNSPVRLSDFRGKPVIINFWASWCPPCRSEMPDFDAAYKQYGDAIVFLMINLTDGSHETMARAQSYVDKQRYSFPVYFDTEAQAAIAYDIRTLPQTYFIDRAGHVAAYAASAIGSQHIEQGIGLIMPQPN
ncbi:MAG: TlpA family protein disulfide reductase [Treponema sp.]|nr:TlpA family protein disulfide reductase [Treponema sp.]